MRTTSDKSSISRRSFLANAATAGVVLPSLLDVAVTGSPMVATEAEPLRLHRNESSYGLHPAAAEALRNAGSAKPHRYPIEEPTVLVEALAKRVGMTKENIVLGAGSLEILRMATEAFCSPSRGAIVAEPTFEAVVSFCPLAHARAVKIPLTKDHKHDMPRILRAASGRAGMIFFCNPSNPVGTFIDKVEVERFVRRLPRGVVLLADEAYFDYVDSPAYESCLRFVKEGLPVVVSHTFSKIYGMAGLRVGYAIGRKDLIKRMAELRIGNSPNQVATAAALAAHNQDEWVDRVRKLNSDVRAFLSQELRAMGFTPIPSQANFVMTDLGRPSKAVIETLKQRHVLVGRLFPSMPNHMRVGLGTMAEMKLFLKEFRDVMSIQPASPS